MKNVGSMYIHIPFCNKICNYCDFSKMYYKKEWVVSYLKELMLEIDSSYNNDILSTLYVGGGTPSCLAMNELKALFNKINTFPFSDDYEFTFECNLEDINDELMAFLKKNRVNRLSIGVESFNKRLLDVLGRSYNFDIREKISLAKKYFDNINVDLIFGVYSETLDDLKEELDNFLSLDVKHISLYSLILENNTVLKSKEYKELTDDLQSDMYKMIIDVLKKNGFIHYEISNFCKEGYHSRHNMAYWNNENYYGFGLGASGYLSNVRYSNTRSINRYLKHGYRYEEDILSRKETMENEMILGLRKVEGVNKERFYKKYNCEIDDVFDTYKLSSNKDFYFIDEDKLFISNSILCDFVDI